MLHDVGVACVFRSTVITGYGPLSVSGVSSVEENQASFAIFALLLSFLIKSLFQQRFRRLWKIKLEPGLPMTRNLVNYQILCLNCQHIL